MSEDPELHVERAAGVALRPLLAFASGVGAASAAAALTPVPGPASLRGLLVALGIVAALVALVGHRRGRWALWLVAGLALATGRGLAARADVLALTPLLAPGGNEALRVEAVIHDGWEATRWGFRCKLRAVDARHRDRRVVLPASCPLEVRGGATPLRLPGPGARVELLAALRGEPSRPLLVVSSPLLIRETGPPTGLARLRQLLADRLLAAAGTEARRIRAAELVAGLALGRRDLIPVERREGWRRSGLAHMLAVSGLHVGLVGSAVWLLALVAGLRPGPARVVMLLVLPAYALLAGAAPTAMRAALMGMTYFGARLLGRALVPLAAVLLAATALLLAAPGLIADAGFQLTVVITAALVRWTAPVAARLPGPRWLSVAVAVPLVAQVAAVPLVGWHFRSEIPGAALANLAVPLLLTPAMVLSLAATATAPLLPWVGRLLLDGVSACAGALWLAAGPARALELIPPLLPAALATALALVGWCALAPGRSGRAGAAAWLVLITAWTGWWLLAPPAASPGVSLLEVRDGLAALVVADGQRILVDGGRLRREALELLAAQGVRRLDAIVASHGEEDHIGGLQAVVEHLPVGQLLLPAWMLGDPASAELVRTARRRGTRVVPVVRGRAVALGAMRLEVLWPPELGTWLSANERSLVARLRFWRGRVLITSDIAEATERRLVANASLACEVLIAPHHGSRASSSRAFLEAARPQVVLVPAGPENLHQHPHAETLERLHALRLPFRVPARDGLCGASPGPDGRWHPFP